MAGKGKIALGYFFGPRLDGLPGPEHLAGLRPADAVIVGRFGDLGLWEGEWPVLGPSPGWDRAEWPVPVFVYQDPILKGTWWRRFYDPDDPDPLWHRQERIPAGEPHDGWGDRLYGSGSVEIRLTHLLAPDGAAAPG
jgi:hypothetical protein